MAALGSAAAVLLLRGQEPSQCPVGVPQPAMAPVCSRASAAALVAALAATLAPRPATGAEAFLGKGLQQDCWEGNGLDLTNACQLAHGGAGAPCHPACNVDSCQYDQGAYCWQCSCDIVVSDLDLDGYVKGVCGEEWCAKLRDGRDDCEAWMMSKDCR